MNTEFRTRLVFIATCGALHRRFLSRDPGQRSDAGDAHEMRAALRHLGEAYYDSIIVRLSLYDDAETIAL
jgi:hypothetical protein